MPGHRAWRITAGPATRRDGDARGRYAQRVMQHAGSSRVAHHSGDAAPARAGAAPGTPSAEPAEELSHVADQQIRLLHRREVAAPVELGPAHDVVRLGGEL